MVLTAIIFAAAEGGPRFQFYEVKPWQTEALKARGHVAQTWPMHAFCRCTDSQPAHLMLRL